MLFFVKLILLIGVLVGVGFFTLLGRKVLGCFYILKFPNKIGLNVNANFIKSFSIMKC